MPTRKDLLFTLKQVGEARADELAEALAITSSAVRQHLSSLAAEGLVTHEERRAGPGRPKHVYRLTEAAEGLFPKRYGDLATELLQYVEAADPDLVDRLFAQRRQRRIADARTRLAGKSLPDQVAELTRILDEDGYLAALEPIDDGGYRIVEHNCAILEVARRYGHACSSELEFIRKALPAARVERVQHMMAGAHVCAYEVRPRVKSAGAPGPAARGRRGPTAS
ncbi:MAG: helix-turn-helix transcriptional regulator [Acidimicrobiales bacterium]